MKHVNSILFLASIVLGSGLTATAQTGSYPVVKTFRIQSGGGWDYLAINPASNYLYVSHSTQVNILDKTTGDSVGVISGTEGVHGIAFVPGLKKGYTTNGKLNTATVFNTDNNAILSQVATGENPDAIMYDPFSKKVYICNGRSQNLTVIDPANDKVIKTIALGGKPETAISDEEGKLYINIEDKSEIVVVNTKTYAVEHRWTIGNGKEPSGLAIDIKTKRLFAGCDNKLLIVLNAANGKVVTELPIGDGCDGVAFDDVLKNVYSSNGQGTLTVIREKSADKYEVMAQAPTKKGARTIAVDQATHMVYLPTADFAAPTPTDQGHKRPGIVPGSFQILVVAPSR